MGIHPELLKAQVGDKRVTHSCPHCKQSSILEVVQLDGGDWNDDTNQWRVKAYRCPCGGHTFVRSGPNGAQQVLPPSTPVRPEGVDGEILNDFIEAQMCLAAGAFRATVTMCRRCIQEVAEDKGATVGAKLVEQLKELKTTQVLTPALFDFASQIRSLGNYGAHPKDDGLDKISPQDAAEILEFTREILAHLYSLPSRLDAARQRRQKTA